MVTHELKRFCEQVSYISSPGHLEGSNARERYGIVDGVPLVLCENRPEAGKRCAGA